MKIPIIYVDWKKVLFVYRMANYSKLLEKRYKIYHLYSSFASKSATVTI